MANFNPAAVCPDTGFIRRPSTELCYLHVQSPKDFSEANRTCVRDGGKLVRIESAEEDSWVFDQFYTSGGEREFWIGLNDQDREGDFRYSIRAVEAIYTMIPSPLPGRVHCTCGGLYAKEGLFYEVAW